MRRQSSRSDNSKEFQTRLVAGQVYAAFGEEAKARDLANGLAGELQTEPQVYAKLIDGEIALKNGDGRGAVRALSEANNLLDTWMGRFDLGLAYLEYDTVSQKPIRNSTVASNDAGRHWRFSWISPPLDIFHRCITIKAAPARA